MNKYMIFLPESRGSVDEEWRQCLEQIKDINSQENRLVKLNIFIDVPDLDACLRVRSDISASLKTAFGNQCPAFNITPHPPENPWRVSAEARYTSCGSFRILFKEWNSIPYVVKLTDSGKEVLAGGIGAGLFPDETRKAAEAAFDQMRFILESEQMTFNHIVRQWNYIGNILDVRNGIQNYQIFNEVRSENYYKHRTIKGYPAATGVGIKYGGVNLDFIAVKVENPTDVKPVDNPDQVHPYAYGQNVLVGMPNGKQSVKQPPQFERAIILSNHVSSTLFVSGTASIIGQDTVGIEDIDKQTNVTISNIMKLADASKRMQSSRDSEKNLLQSILLRVYIKYQNDFAKVKAICERSFPKVPAVYIEADICRDDLLVEIEAEYIKG
jgi:hypothetical protein